MNKITFILQIFIILQSFICITKESDKQNEQNKKMNGDMDIKGNLFVKNAIGAQELQTEELQTFQLDTQSTLITNNLLIDSAEIDNLELESFISLNQNNQSILEIDSDIIVTSINVQEKVNFVNLNQQNKQNNLVKDWQLVHHDHFQNSESFMGWNLQEANYCDMQTKIENQQNNNFDNNQNLEINNISPFNTQNRKVINLKDLKEDEDYFLGGHCLASTESLHKTFQNLKQHSQIKINATVHLFDKWEGESLFLYVDKQKVWQYQSSSNQEQIQSNINICGDSHQDQAYGIPVEVIIPHQNQTVQIEFKSNLQKDACLASFAIDNVIINLK